MDRRTKARAARALLPLLLAACNAAGADDSLDGWRGEDPHVRIIGDVEGAPIDVALGASEAAAATWARCHTAPSLSTTVMVLVGAQPHELDFSVRFDGRDSLTPGTRLGVVPAIESEAPAEGRANIEITWRRQLAGGGWVTHTRSALAGTVAIERGGGGSVGLFIDAMWPLGGALTASLTVPCGARDFP